MKIFSWNVNSVRARKERFLAWLDKHQPEVLALQEIKCQDEQFPREEVLERGYQVETFGQKTYNGVALLAKSPIEDVRRGLGDEVDDPQARFISAQIEGIRMVCVYIPNGSSMDSDKAVYKKQWYARLLAHLERLHEPGEPLIVLGDFNVAPRENDVNFLEVWKDGVLFHPEMRAALQGVCDWGLEDLFAKLHPEGGVYSWWDYRQLGFPRDDGLRIDLLLGTEPVTQRLKAAGVDRDERKGKKPSDHAPVWVELG